MAASHLFEQDGYDWKLVKIIMPASTACETPDGAF
jgi:hypothetical protein